MPEFVFLYDKGLYVGLKFMGSLCSVITAGNHYAMQSYDKIPMDFYNIKSYLGCYYIRCLDFSASVLWYNSAMDYFLQFFCSVFNLYPSLTEKKVIKI